MPEENDRRVPITVTVDVPERFEDLTILWDSRPGGSPALGMARIEVDLSGDEPLIVGVPTMSKRGAPGEVGLTAEEMSRIDWRHTIETAIRQQVYATAPTMDDIDEAGGAIRRRAYRKTGDVDLERVAELYVQGKRKAVCKGMHMPERTASRWIARAREEGLLP